MKKLAFLLFLVFNLAVAQSNADEYSITVHVTASRCLVEPFINGTMPALKLNVLIGGKKFELKSTGACSLLQPGDYKAKLITDKPPNNYELSQTYEFKFADGKTKRLEVVGVLE